MTMVTFRTPDRFASAAVEAGLCALTLAAAAFGAGIWVAMIVAALGLLWWVFTRWPQLERSGPVGALGATGVSIVVLALVHGCAWALGAAAQSALRIL